MANRMIGAQPITSRSSIAISAFGRRLTDYKSWRDALAAIISEFQTWIEAQGLDNGEDDLRVYELIDALKSDTLTVALVAEFSRGKTELINAIFFSDFKQRLLPSDAGRTTMCPTELLYNEKLPPCLKLLPIATRKSSLTIAEYKRTPQQWTVLPLDLNHPNTMADTFLQLVKTQTVSAREAEELGLFNPQTSPTPLPSDGMVQIPVWRHAIINMPHALLKQGLVVLDTPGLNSLGTEPELTLNMLPSAHAVLFVLAADAGVTKSDLDVWNNHVCVAKHGPNDARIVVLNKVDVLWDELRTPEMVSASLDRQIADTERILGVARRQIFPVSAQKGLLGKIKTDHALITRSGLVPLESKLSNDVVGAKQELMREKITREISSIVDRARVTIEARLAAVDAHLLELQSLSGKSQEAIQQMLERMRSEKQAYDKTIASFQATRAMLSDSTQVLLDYLGTENFDALMTRTRTAMKESWTTHGLQVGMKMLFDGATDMMEKANLQAQQIVGLVNAVYNKFHADHGLASLKPAPFSLAIHRDQLQRLVDETEVFRKSPIMVMTEQHFVIKKFFITLASRARMVHQECNSAARAWSKAIMAPILAQVREHKIMMDHRIENLKRVHENLGNLSARIAELETTKHSLENQLTTIANMLRKIHQPSDTKLNS
jgi:predicted  nucleic acid-binding Zn-ribbon protein